MLLVINPQNYGPYAEQQIGHAAGCARIALAKEISIWKGDIFLIGFTERHPGNQVVNIVLDGLIAHNRVIEVDCFDETQIAKLKQHDVTTVRIIGSSARRGSHDLADIAAVLHRHGIQSFIGECLDDRINMPTQTMAA